MASSVVFNWNSLDDQFTCSEVHLSWLYIGAEDISIDISITNVDVEQTPTSTPVIEPTNSFTSSSTTSRRPITFSNEEDEVFTFRKRQDTAGTETASAPTSTSTGIQFFVARGVSVRSRQFDWASLTAPEGFYEFIAASDDGLIDEHGPRFRVFNGTDISCLVGSNPSGSSTLPPAGSTSSGNGPSETNPSSPDNSGGTSHTKEIVGGVIGGLAGLILIGILLFLFCRRRRTRNMHAMGSSHVDGAGMVGSVRSSQSGKKHKKGGKWGGLSSVDSIAGATGSHERKPSASVGRSHQTDARDYPGTLAMTDRSHSARSGSSPIHTTEDDKEKGSSPFGSDEGGMYTFTPESLGYHYPSDTGSRASGHTPILPPTIRSEPLYPSGVSNVLAEDILNYDQPTTTPTSSVPPTSATPLVPASTPSPKHKMPRKRVPSYTPSTISGLGTPPTTATPPAKPTPSPLSSTPSSSPGHYAISGTRSPLTDAQLEFGKDGQVHYLIPDMPSGRS